MHTKFLMLSICIYVYSDYIHGVIIMYICDAVLYNTCKIKLAVTSKL